MFKCKTVTLRTRPIKHGQLSFYLDYYPGYRDKETMKVIRHESLGIYIYEKPKNRREREFNEQMTEKAEAIRCRRFDAIVNERYDFLDKSKLKGDFLEYYRHQLRKHDQKWKFVYINKVTKVITFLRNKRMILQENGKKYSLVKVRT